MTTPNVPIVNAGEKYVNGLAIEKNTATELYLHGGRCRNSTNVNDIILDATHSILLTKQGKGGIDIGTVAPDSWYAVYVIADSTSKENTAGILSLDSDQPLLPFGYDMFRRVGFIRTTSGSIIQSFYQTGEGTTRKYWWDGIVTSAGGGSSTFPTFADIDLNDFVPPIGASMHVDVVLNLEYNPAVNLSYSRLRTKGSGSSAQVEFGNGNSTDTSKGQVNMVANIDSNKDRKIQYSVDDAGDNLNVYVSAYVDVL